MGAWQKSLLIVYKSNRIVIRSSYYGNVHPLKKAIVGVLYHWCATSSEKGQHQFCPIWGDFPV